jgi:hypothetical protein
MKQLSKNQSILFFVASVLMVVGAGMYVFGVQKVAPWIFAIGAFTFAALQMQQRYDGKNPVIRRLRRIMLMADVCFMLSAVFMVENGYNFLLPTFCKSGIDGYNAYLLYIHNNWVVLLLIAAILELYSTHRISNELEKEAKKP